MAITGLGNGVGVCIEVQNASNCGSIDLCREADARAFYGRWVHDFADRGGHRGDGFVLVPVFAFKLIELLGKRLFDARSSRNVTSARTTCIPISIARELFKTLIADFDVWRKWS